MLKPPQVARRAIPSVDRLLRAPDVVALIEAYGRPLVVEALRATLDAARAQIDAVGDANVDEARFTAACALRLQAATRSTLRPVFNLTGTVLHTNLGRALMPPSVIAAVGAAMARSVNLEFDLDTGARGERDRHVEHALARLTGADAAAVVNNNAAAVYLVLSTLASRKEVVVSRGELVEIGGSFRIPDIMARAGCRLCEVGTTNRTHARDYGDAIGARTGALMKVHTSNYAIQGFTASVPERELGSLAHERGVPFVVDLGSGTLVDLSRYGLPHEPTVRETLANGADLVTFSGDKLLGGPQCGLIVGRADFVDKVRRNPMKRALRVDKITLAALDATLRLYADPDRLANELPTLRLLTRTREDIEAAARRLLPHVVAAVDESAHATVVPCLSQIGSGSLPVDVLPSAALALTPKAGRRRASVQRLADTFRALPTPVIGRIQDGTLLLDLRCLDDEDGFVAQLRELRMEAKA
jgi:L-seryl-tRNA(Ser) seleniumtransferase